MNKHINSFLKILTCRTRGLGYEGDYLVPLGWFLDIHGHQQACTYLLSSENHGDLYTCGLQWDTGTN